MLGIALILIGVLMAISGFGFFKYIYGSVTQIGMILFGIGGLICTAIGIVYLL